MPDRPISGGTFVVTGGANLIGSHITEALLEEGAARVVIFDSFYFGPSPHIEPILADERVELVRGDVMRLDQLLTATEGADGLFSMAALLAAPMAKDPRTGVTVNVEGLINQLDACRFNDVGKLVLASSISVYGDAIDGLIDETRHWGPNTLAPPFAIYSLSKLMGEQLGRHYVATYDVGFSSVRFSTVYGERQHSRGVNTQAIPRTIADVRAGRAPELFGGGHDAHDYIHASDVAAGAIAAMRRGREGEAYNIASGVSTTTRQIVELVLDALGSDLRPVDVVDDRPHRGTAHAELLLDISKAREELGWAPEVAVDRGIERLVQWFLEQEVATGASTT